MTYPKQEKEEKQIHCHPFQHENLWSDFVVHFKHLDEPKTVQNEAERRKDPIVVVVPRKEMDYLVEVELILRPSSKETGDFDLRELVEFEAFHIITSHGDLQPESQSEHQDGQ